MTSDPTSFDAYRSPVLPDEPIGVSGKAGRPGWLTTLCVLAIVLGALGILNSLLGVGGILAGKALQSVIHPKAGAGVPDDMQEAQEQYQNDMYAIQDKYLWALVPSLAMRFVVATLLLVAGIKALSLDEKGRRLLVVAFAVALVFELLYAILQSFVLMENLTATNSYVEKLSNSMNQQNDIAKTIGQVVAVLTVVLTTIILLLKIALYIFGLVYLRRDPIRALFGATKSASPLASIA